MAGGRSNGPSLGFCLGWWTLKGPPLADQSKESRRPGGHALSDPAVPLPSDHTSDMQTPRGPSHAAPSVFQCCLGLLPRDHPLKGPLAGTPCRWSDESESQSEVSESCPTLCDPMDCRAYQATLSTGFSRQEYWSGLPFPSPGGLPQPRDRTWFSRIEKTLYCLSYQGSLRWLNSGPQICPHPNPQNL